MNVTNKMQEVGCYPESTSQILHFIISGCYRDEQEVLGGIMQNSVKIPRLTKNRITI